MVMGEQGEDERWCRTPRQERCKIPATACPPPPPRKKGAKHRILPPKDGYFQPPDIELFFALAFTRPQQQAADATQLDL
ncbi:hypothetical protein C2S53_000753 [Perilla frutescens var. hirtella]|uniref:Uncharacterized protein n=1 Tax=Perilla frutescens var. hirtella TaxID=608512 RepID=A0AAD4J4V3_PERFH|nr:hypothetical protein C2S53_000753 [Perilla frutescens var. hirtella]